MGNPGTYVAFRAGGGPPSFSIRLWRRGNCRDVLWPYECPGRIWYRNGGTSYAGARSQDAGATAFVFDAALHRNFWDIGVVGSGARVVFPQQPCRLFCRVEHWFPNHRHSGRSVRSTSARHGLSEDGATRSVSGLGRRRRHGDHGMVWLGILVPGCRPGGRKALGNGSAVLLETRALRMAALEGHTQTGGDGASCRHRPYRLDSVFLCRRNCNWANDGCWGIGYLPHGDESRKRAGGEGQFVDHADGHAAVCQRDERPSPGAALLPDSCRTSEFGCYATDAGSGDPCASGRLGGSWTEVGGSRWPAAMARALHDRAGVGSPGRPGSWFPGSASRDSR